MTYFPPPSKEGENVLPCCDQGLAGAYCGRHHHPDVQMHTIAMEKMDTRHPGRRADPQKHDDQFWSSKDLQFLILLLSDCQWLQEWRYLAGYYDSIHGNIPVCGIHTSIHLYVVFILLFTCAWHYLCVAFILVFSYVWLCLAFVAIISAPGSIIPHRPSPLTEPS